VLVELIGLDAADRRRRVDQALVDHVHRNADSGVARALGRARLQHPEPPAFDRKLQVLRVAEVFLQPRRHPL
jgi:hypothetical protein